MSTVLLALSEALRTLSMAGDYLPEEKLSSIISDMAECYSSELDLAGSRAFLESFEIVRNAITSRPMSDEDELVVRIFAYNLRAMEERYGLDREAIEERFIRRINDTLGDDFTKLVIMFVRSIKGYADT
ncbi:MAG: hypothetical protein BA066_00300 [Candidatus Korarchaeota archaeon NZ13-K]|nr:MAG: hypothetical protein BA066_00300 [Candidatus Korarchaeota archaeon NZ13-K]